MPRCLVSTGQWTSGHNKTPTGEHVDACHWVAAPGRGGGKGNFLRLHLTCGLHFPDEGLDARVGTVLGDSLPSLLPAHYTDKVVEAQRDEVVFLGLYGK